jgi:hypothetical protein
MKKTKIAFGKKLILNKENITDLDTDQQGRVAGGAVSQNICVNTQICPVIQTTNCISKKQTWCWVAGSSC